MKITRRQLRRIIKEVLEVRIRQSGGRHLRTLREEEEFDFLEDMGDDDDFKIPQTAPPRGQKDFEDEIFEYFQDNGLLDDDGKKIGNDDFTNSKYEKEAIFNIAKETGYLEGKPPGSLLKKTSEEIIAHYIGSERAQYDISAEKIQGAKQSDGKRLVILKSIYSSLSKAGLSDDEIGKLAEFKGKDVAKLGNENIMISDDRIKELNNMAAKGKSSYSTKADTNESRKMKISRRQLRRLIKEELSAIHESRGYYNTPLAQAKTYASEDPIYWVNRKQQVYKIWKSADGLEMSQDSHNAHPNDYPDDKVYYEGN